MSKDDDKYASAIFYSIFFYISKFGGPIVASNNLVKSKPDCSKEGEKEIKQDN